MFHTQMVFDSAVYLFGGWCSYEINIRAFPIMRSTLPNIDHWDAIYLQDLYCENPGIIRFSDPIFNSNNKFLIFGEEQDIIFEENIHNFSQNSKYIIYRGFEQQKDFSVFYHSINDMNDENLGSDRFYVEPLKTSFDELPEDLKAMLDDKKNIVS